MYRQLTGWCSVWLGKNVRVVLPSCAVSKIVKVVREECKSRAT